MTYTPFATSTARMTDHITLTTLKNRGWSPGLITKLIGEPDKLVPNPHGRRAPPMRLYRLARVVAAEEHPAFIEHQQRRGRLVEAAKQRAETQRVKLLADIEVMQVTVQKISLKSLAHQAVRHWEERKEDWDGIKRNGSKAEVATKTRWMVNYARHVLTAYDENLEEVAGRIGADAARHIIREKVYCAIASVWPTLAEECTRQLGSRASS